MILHIFSFRWMAYQRNDLSYGSHYIFHLLWRNWFKFLCKELFSHKLYFFFIWVFFHEHSRITGLQGKEEGIPLTPHYHFYPLHRHLDISRAIAPESSPLHIGSSRTWTGNLWMSLWIYLCWPDSRRPSLSRRANRAGSFLFNSLKSCVRLSLPSLPLKVNPWRARKRINFLIFIKYFLSARRLLLRSLTVISNTSPHWDTTNSYIIVAPCNSIDCWWSTNTSRAFFQLLNLFVI